MKKSVIIAVLGVAASVATSYGQGYIAFDTYGSSPASYVFNFGTTTPVADGVYNAVLYYALGTVSDPVTMSSASSVTSDPTGLQAFSGATSGGSSVVSIDFGNGSIQGPGLIIGNYVSGPITFEIVAYNGSTYDTSSSRGRSGSFTMTSINNNTVYSYFGDNGTPSPNFVVASVPEPTTLALAGLGGLASLVAFRRKQA